MNSKVSNDNIMTTDLAETPLSNESLLLEDFPAGLLSSSVQKDPPINGVQDKRPEEPMERTSMFIESNDIERGSMETRWKESTDKGSMSRDVASLLTKCLEWGKLYKNVGYFFWLIIAIIIQLSFGLGSWAFPDGKPACYSSDLNKDGKVQNQSICLLAETLAGGVPILRFLSAFIIGGFVASSINLWLIRRTAYCALCGATRNLIINVCSIVPNKKDKMLLARWVILGYELAVLKGRGLIDSDAGKSYLEKLRVMQSDEWSAMVDGDRHTTVWYWIQVKAEKLMQKEELSLVSFQTICQAVTLSRDKANDLMSFIDRSQPPPYVFICGVLVDANLAIYTVTKGIQWAIWMYDSNGTIWKEPRMYADALILLLYTTIYGMLFDLCTILHNPFGPRDIDVEHHKVGKGLRNLAKKLSKGTNPLTMDSQQVPLRSMEDEDMAFYDNDDVADFDRELCNFVAQPSKRSMLKGRQSYHREEQKRTRWSTKTERTRWSTKTV